MDLSRFASGDPVRARGFVTPFGMAPTDFTALSIANTSEIDAKLQVRWQPPSLSGIALAADPASLLLDLTGADRVHHLVIAGIRMELDPEQPISVVPAAESGIFVLAVRGASRAFNTFNDFAAALAEHLELGAAAAAISAAGDYDASNFTFTTRRLAVILSESHLE